MKFLIKRDVLLKTLSLVQGVVEKKNTLPILSNVLLETKNNTTKDALYQILNGMSSAVNGLWDFQIVEKESELHEGVTELTVIDLNFVSSAPGAINLTMNTQGEQSILIDSSLDLGISSIYSTNF